MGPPGGDVSPAAQSEPTLTARAQDVELADLDFRFLDPPEPGAHARLTVTLHNRADLPTEAVVVTIPAGWFAEFEVLGAVPAVLDDRAGRDGGRPGEVRRFVWAGLAPGESRTLELHVISRGEAIDGPDARVGLAEAGVDGTMLAGLAEGAAGGVAEGVAEIGGGRPRTVAPRPRPGPVRAVAIPKLGVRASVVQVPWEPPPFVVGQIQGSAAVSEGNTVLLGHLAGPWGDVFARLDRLRPGDEVVATSRGLEYRFVVSEVAVRPYDDVSPTLATETPRLTLMTCTGQWNVLRQDYSHRLWVVAEPPELAEQTIRANAERAAQAAREAEQGAAERAAHEAEANPALAPPLPMIPAPTPQPPPPQAGEGGSPHPSPSGSTPHPPSTRVTPASGRGGARTGVAAANGPGEGAGERQVPELVPGVTIEEPGDGAGVLRQLTVRGRRTADVDGRAPLWLVVRAEVEGSRWYALRRPLDVDAAGRWHASLELGGEAGVRHEIRVGIVDGEADALLRRHAAERAGQPLDDLPSGFQAGARIVVRRE